MEMAYAAMAAETVGLICLSVFAHLGGRCFDGGHHVGMTMATRRLRHLAIALGDLNRIGKFAAREIKGMPETVLRFRRIFADEIVS